MEDSDPGEKVIYQLRDPLPVRAILLAAPVKRAAPEVDDPIAERRECPTIGRNCVVCEKAGKDLLQPFSLLGNWLMPPLSHLLFHFLELGPQAVASGLPLKKESAVAACAANEGKTQKIESLRFSKPALRPVVGREATELDQACLVRVE
jgi:hypothetical protein